MELEVASAHKSKNVLISLSVDNKNVWGLLEEWNVALSEVHEDPPVSLIGEGETPRRIQARGLEVGRS